MENPNYYAVIPADVRYSDIPDGAKLLYGEITALCSKEGFCWASNAYFASLYKVTERTASSWVSELEKNDFVKLSFDSGSMRKIYLTPRKKLLPPTKKTSTPPRKKLLPSITYSNTNNTYGLRPFVEEVQISEEEERPRVDRRTRDKEAIYRLFSEKPQPWWRHKAQRDAALSLFDMVGIEKVKAGIEFMREHADDKFCPQASTPFEYEQKMPKLKQYAKRKNV